MKTISRKIEDKIISNDEMNEILEDKSLVNSLKKGQDDIKKGRFRIAKTETSENLQIPLIFKRSDEKQMLIRSEAFLETMARRRTVRKFSEDSVDGQIIENAIRVAASAPSGANMQPWHFVAISDLKMKKEIRIAAENVENEFYKGKAGEKWLGDLKDLSTNADKPFLEKAPWLIAVFVEKYRIDGKGEKKNNYYVSESVGIATGMLITAFHLSGLATLTYTPAPMNFLNTLLNRPSNEKPIMVLACGYPAKNATVPAIGKKPLDEILTIL